MKVIGVSDPSGYKGEYICTMSHRELEKFLGLYYDKMEKLKVGEEIDLGKGYDYASQIGDAMRKTQEFVKANQQVVTAILNGLRIESMTREAPQAQGAGDQT